MRISDWSSDVCSSDLIAGAVDPDAVGLFEFVVAERRHVREPGQAQHLHAAVVALDHEQQLVHHGDAIGPVELALARTAAANVPQGLAGGAVVDHEPDRKSTRLNSSH